mgnify:FL=1
MGLAHGGLRQKTYVAYEEAIRVPLVISNPLLFKEQRQQNSFSLATLADIFPTFIDMANIENPPTGLAGTSLLPILEDDTPVQKSILFTYDDTKAGSNNSWSLVNAANRIRCIRTEKWKYDIYFDTLGTYYNQYELYDLVNDPQEVTNLAYDPAYAETRALLEKELHALEIKKLRAITIPKEQEAPILVS